MNEEVTAIKITFITPCFCRGANGSSSGEPEIRPASIRGQLHWWFRALGGTPEEESAVFGTVRGKRSASKLVVRVRLPEKQTTESLPTLPHKSDNDAASRMAFCPGTSFELLLSWRLGGVGEELREQFKNALDAWLHMGALGLRATRGGGNFTWEGQQKEPEKYKESIVRLSGRAGMLADLLGETFPNAESARTIITDTATGEKLLNVNRPLGGNNPRKTSPLRFRVVQFGESDYRILAVWDGRQSITGNTKTHLQSAVDILVNGNKRIGFLLNSSSLL